MNIDQPNPHDDTEGHRIAHGRADTERTEDDDTEGHRYRP